MACDSVLGLMVLGLQPSLVLAITTLTQCAATVRLPGVSTPDCTLLEGANCALPATPQHVGQCPANTGDCYRLEE